MKAAYTYLAYLQERTKVLFNLDLRIDLAFDLKGYRTLGQCKYIHQYHYLIRLHGELLTRYEDIYLEDVLTHEIAHAIQFARHHNRTKPHGKEWRTIMEQLEGKPYQKRNRPTYDTKPYRQKKRQIKYYPYRCGCDNKTHQLTAIRHNRIQKRTYIYVCKTCNFPLFFH